MHCYAPICSYPLTELRNFTQGSVPDFILFHRGRPKLAPQEPVDAYIW